MYLFLRIYRKNYNKCIPSDSIDICLFLYKFPIAFLNEFLLRLNSFFIASGADLSLYGKNPPAVFNLSNMIVASSAICSVTFFFSVKFSLPSDLSSVTNAVSVVPIFGTF